MRPEKVDLSIARNVLNLLIGLSSADKAVAGVILGHLNMTTGQCDPSVGRIARILGVTEKTVKRATADLCGKHQLFTKSSHGGSSGRASYEPCWSKFRDLNADFQRRMRTGEGPDGDTEKGTEMSTRRGQKCPTSGDKNDPQTIIINSSKELNLSPPSQTEPHGLTVSKASDGLLNNEEARPRNPNNEAREKSRSGDSSRAGNAWSAAEWRVDEAIKGLPPDVRQVAWALLDAASLNAAIGEEVKRRGGGLAFIVASLRTARLQDIEGRHGPVH
ncbi:hypothetical protein ASC97_01245 [Rhizobium sp. Root1203]|uniref:helix-turn-helix domain-containing protein n=1 Tax=Rhizobium sp. Root1203 TaxID=1736427 RepID=UPI0007093B76|nr:hypothetical protein ASC97_01245 [Rhizobium sp. Root1203]